jgi:hypothetical protein
MSFEPPLAVGERADLSARSAGPTASELVRTTVTAVLLALLVTWMFTAWWTAPRASDVAQLDRSVAAGDVTSYMRISGFERSGSFWAASQEPVTSDHGRTIMWQTTSGQTFYVSFGSLAGGPFPGPAAPGEVISPNPVESVAAVEQKLQDEGVQQFYRVGDAGRLAMVLVIGGLILLVAGPVPTRGNRWFWFWTAGAPGGLGVLAYVLAERIWPSARPLPLDRRSDRRWHGFAGFGVYLLAGLCAAIAVPWLRDLLGTSVVPGWMPF